MLLRRKKTKKAEPTHGDYRVDILYAWWPTRTEDGLVWLEKYKRIYEYTVRVRHCRLGYGYMQLTCGGWDLRATKRIKRP